MKDLQAVLSVLAHLADMVTATSSGLPQADAGDVAQGVVNLGGGGTRAT